MDLAELANVGEFVGGIAVLVTLVYLAVQLRQSNILAAAEAYHKSTSAFSGWRQLVADEGLNAVWVKAQGDETLSPEEERRLYVTLCELTWVAVATLGNQRAVGDRSFDELAPMSVARELRSRTLREAWSRVAEDLADYGYDEFRLSVEALLSANAVRVQP